MKGKSVLLELNNQIAYITINRPKVLNAINYDVLNELEEAIDAIEKNNNISVVIIKGSGKKAFVAGADIEMINEFDTISAKRYVKTGQNLFTRIETLKKVVIAAINGYALGGGCELALACDIRIATEKSEFGLPETSLGMIPGFGGTQRLPRLIGTSYAKEMMFTGNIITAQKAKEIGLVNHVVEEDKLMDICKELADIIAKNSPVAVSLCKASINEGTQMKLTRAIAHEAALFSVCFNSSDRVEGISAFREKRKANFNGSNQ